MKNKIKRRMISEGRRLRKLPNLGRTHRQPHRWTKQKLCVPLTLVRRSFTKVLKVENLRFKIRLELKAQISFEPDLLL